MQPASSPPLEAQWPDLVAAVSAAIDLEATARTSGALVRRREIRSAEALLRLALLTGEYDYEERAVGVFKLLHRVAFQHPQAFAHLLQAIDFHLAAVKEVALVGEDTAPLERVVRAAFRPHLVLAGGASDGVPLLQDREPVDGRAAAYVCENFACQRPVTEPAELERLLD